jgi:hypothetical protein
MGYLDNILNPQLDPIIQHRRMLEANEKYRNEQIKNKLINDPTAADHILARLSRSAMTDKTAAKMPEGASFEKAMAGIDKDDPRRAMLAQLSTDMPNIIRSSGYGEDPSATIMKAVQERGATAKEDTYKFIQGRSGFFGKEVAPEAGYDEWEQKNPGWSNPFANAAIGAGGELASIPILGKAAQLAMRGSKLAGPLRLLGGALSMAPPIGVGLPAKLLGAGLMSMTAMAGIDAVKKAAASGGHPLSTMEEIAAGLPIFAGVSGLAKMGGKAVGSRLASLKGGLDVFGDNVVSSAATRGVSREDISTVSKAMRMDLETAAAQKAKMESFRKLDPEDHEAILRGANADEVMNARVKVNMEKNVVETAAKKKAMDDEIVSSAERLRAGDSTLDHPSSLELARRRLSPTGVETSEDFAYLRSRGLPEDVVASMNPRQAAENRMAWETHGEKTRQMQGHLPAVRDSFTDMLPQPVAANKIRTGIRLQGVTPGVVNAGMPERLGLPAGTGTVETKIAPVQQELGRVTKTSDLLRTDATDFTVGIKKQAEEIKSFTGSELEKRSKIDMLAINTYDHLNSLEQTYKGAVGAKKIAELTRIREDILKGLRPIAEDEGLIEAAKHEVIKIAEPLMPGSSPATHEKLLGSSKIYKRLRNEGTIEFGKLQKEDTAGYESWVKKYGMYFKDIPKIAAIVGGAALVPITALLGGSEAEAAPFPGRSILQSSMEAIRSSGKPVEGMVAKLFEAGHGSPVLTEDGHGIVQLMRGISAVPKDVNVFPKTNVVSKLDSILSPHTRGEIHFDARGAGGERLPHNAAVELADRSQVANANIEATLKAVRNILKDNGITGDLKDITDATLPLAQKYHETVNLHVPYYSARVQMLDDVLEGKYKSTADTEANRVSALFKASGKDLSKLDPEDQAAYQVFKDARNSAADELAKLKPITEEFAKDHNAVMRQLAVKHSTSRVAMAVDGTGMSDADPWLRNMLSAQEKRAVEEITSINQAYAVRMQETGHQILGGSYMHHPAHPSVNFQESLKSLEKIAPDGADAMRMVNFFHRSAGSKLMLPDTAYIMAKYVPDAAKRIEISDFWKPGKEGGWDFARKQMQARGGYDGALKLLDDLRTAFDPMDVGTGGKFLNRYAAFEVARLLTLSPSVSFKHALKLMGNWSIFPTGTSAKATGENVGLWTRQIAQDLAGDTFKGKDLVADLGKAYTNQSHMYAAVSDMAPYEMSTNVYDKFISKWNELGSAAVNGVERWDRGQTFMSAMMMAQKKGMTPDQARYALMDSVLKVNFLTGPNNPKWLKDPFIRTMMLFQGTPFKILEQRAMLGAQSYKDTKGAFRELLGQLKTDVKEGESRFKLNLVKDELFKSKDIYGTPYTSQFLKQMMTIGTVIATGKMAFDSNLWGHVIHIPGTQLGEKGVQLGLNPAIGAAYKTAMSIGKEGEDEFWMSRFFNNWITQSGFPAIAHKMARLKDDDIPIMYKEGKLSYLFGVPRNKEK